MSENGAIGTLRRLQQRPQSLLKTLPGILVSLFFLWYTFFPHGKDLVSARRGAESRSPKYIAIRAEKPAWLLGILGFTASEAIHAALRPVDAHDALDRSKVRRMRPSPDDLARRQ